MAFGTLKADTLTHSTAGSLATNFVVNGSAKAWAETNSAGTSILDSFTLLHLWIQTQVNRLVTTLTALSQVVTLV